jgi:hypothetical protein
MATRLTLIFALLIALCAGCGGSDSPAVQHDPNNAASGDDVENGDHGNADGGPAKPRADASAGGKLDAGAGNAKVLDARTSDQPSAKDDSGIAHAGDSGPAGSADSATPPSSAGKLPRVTTTDGPGPFKEVVKVKSTPPGGWLIYPKDIGKDGIKHPLFIFGPGGGTTPDTYETMGMHWDRYGSYGFVIYVLPQSTGDGAPMKAGLDWLIKQNDEMSSPLYQKLDTTKVCAAGHSQGSVTTFAFMPDDRVTTTIHISGGSFDGMGPSHLRKDSMFLCGPDGNADVAEPQCETDFKNSTVPTFYTKIKGSSHLTSGRLGWAAVIAWMLWHLADQEDQWKKEFLEPTGQFQMGIYTSQTKNWK